MSRATIGWFVVIVAILAVTAPVAAQSAGLVVVSQHSTESDFQSGSLTDVTVHGSGTGSFVAGTTTQSLSDSASNVSPTSSQSISVGGDLDPRGPSGAGGPELTVTARKFMTEWVADFSDDCSSGGGYCLQSDGDSDSLDLDHGQAQTIEQVRINAEIGAAASSTDVAVLLDGTQVGTISVDDVDATWYDLSGLSHQTSGSTTNVTLQVTDYDGDVYVTGGGSSPGKIQLHSPTPGGLSVSTDDGAAASFGDFSDGQSKSRTIDLTTSSSSLDWAADTAGGDIDWQLDGQEVHYDGEGSYTSTAHDGSEIEEGFTNLTLSNAEAVVTWEYYDGSAWQTADSTTYTTTGNHTADLSATDSEQWRVDVTFNSLGSDPTARLNDEGILFAPQSPSITSASPAPGAETTDPEINLAADVEDPDFATAQGDSVTVEFLLDGTEVDQQTITSNQTVTTTVQPSLGGTHNWSVNIEDSYGETDSIATREFGVPSTITIRDEQKPDTLINSTEVQVTAYYSGEIEKRTVNDGKLDLTGFPVDEPIIMRFNATNYTTRTAVVESIYDQDSVFLLNDSAPQYLVRFQSQQLTGDFPEEDTVLFIERDITINGSTEWRTIAGDEFGVRGVPVHLQQGERYRVRIKNLETTQTAIIGGYTAVQSETVDVSAGSAQIDIVDINRSYGWSISENESGQYILAQYEDTANQTESIKLTVHERFNESNVLVDNATFTNTNNLIHEIPLTSDQANKTWTAELYVDRGDGYMNFRVPIGGGPTDILPSDLDDVWVQAIGVFVMLITGMAFSTLNQGVGAISLSLVGGLLWYIGILGVTTVGAAVVASLAISLVYHYRAGGGV